jgi:fibronectin-binding autotransporter adhesin
MSSLVTTLIRRFGWLLALVAVGVIARAQVITQTFTNSTAPGWSFSGSGYTPTLTSGVSDPSGAGWLQLANNGGNEATSAVYNSSFSSANATVYANFSYQMYGGTNGTTLGGDGLTFFLYDASQTFSVGAYGGSMGYAQKTIAGTGGVSGGSSNINGMSGGYLAVGVDAYGNYSSGTEGRVGGYNGATSPVTESVGVRGPGSGLNGYSYLGGSGTLATPLDSATRPTVTNTVQILLSATNQLTVTLAQGGTTPQTVIQMDLSGYSRPNLLGFGFTAGTGGATDIININNLNVTTLAANLWSNSGGNSLWSNNNNWNPTVVPNVGADILFDNTYVNSAQTIDTAASRTVRSISFDAPVNYTLNNNTLTFNNGGVPGFSGIAVTQTHGTATDTINSNLALNNAINIRNNSTGALSLTGTVATSTNTITLDGTGTNTTLSGIISGSGAIIKNDSGTDTLSAANIYSGGTTINNGTLNANNATALGSLGVTLAGGTLGSTNSSTIANSISLTGNAALSGLTTSGTLTETGGNFTLVMSGNATQSGAVNLSDTTTARTLTVQVDTGTDTISGIIANGGGSSGSGLTKVGAGTLLLSGSNTYSGTTTISNGTVQLGASDRLFDTSAVSIGATGALNLNGFSEKVGTLTAAGGATLDFGTATGSNTFLFGTYNAPTSGVLVINNYTNGSDVLGSTVAPGSQPTNGTGLNVNNSIYISGYGLATEAPALSTTIYGTNSAYLLTPTAAPFKEWDGSSGLNWSTNANWTAPNPPTSTQTALFGALGIARPNVTLDTAYTIAGVQFSSNATVSYNITGTKTLTLAGTIPYIQQQSAKDQTLSPTTLTLSNNTVADVTGSGNLTIGAVITGTVNLIKDGTGAGKLILTGNNTLSGGVFISNGVIQAANTGALGTGATTVTSGATLELSGGISPANAISVSGSGNASAGAIHNVSGTNTLTGTITETGATTFAADTGTTLNLTGSVTGTNTATTFAGAGNIAASQILTGTGTVDINVTGNVTYSGSANAYTGNTTVNSGTLILAKTAGTTAIAGNLVVNGGAVQLNASNQIADTSSVTLNNAATLNLGGNAETIGQLTSTSSTAVVALGAGALTISGPNNTNSNYAGTFTGTAASSLNVSGTGKVYLSGNNSSFAGATNVTNGTLNVSGSNGVLGTGNVSISSSGNLQLQGGISLANTVTINGTGTSGNGAIENFAGSNTIAGGLNVAGNSRVQSDAGTLTVSGNVALGTNTLNTGGAGNISITGLIAGTGGLTKDGTGSLTLSHAGNTFSGPTVINAGSVLAAASNIINNSAALTIATGATLSLQTFSETVGNLTGGGLLDFGSSGKLTLGSGSATFSGSFSGTGELVIGPGTSLTLGANFSDPNLKITLAGGSLFLNGTTSTFGALNITGNSILDFGTTSNSTLNVSNVTFSATNLSLNVNNWTNLQDYFYSQAFTGATPNVRNQLPENQVAFTGFTAANTTWMSSDHQITPAPEPATYGMIFVGLSVAAVGLRRIRRNRQPAQTA